MKPKKTVRRPVARETRGFVMLIVLVLLLVLAGAGAHALRSRGSNLQSVAKLRKGDVLERAAEAGAALRMSEIALTTEPIAILDDATLASYRQWTPWPPQTTPPTFTTADYADAGSVQFRTGAIRLTWSGQTPPPGVPLGTNTYIFEITSFATFTDGDMGERAVTVGVKTWDPLPSSYSP